MSLLKLPMSLSIIAFIASGAYAAEIGTDLASAFTSGKIDGQVRGFYMMQSSSMANNASNNNNSGFAMGGNLGFTTAPYYGISAGAKFYTTQILATSNGFAGGSGVAAAPLAFSIENLGVSPGQSYSTLGQAFLQGQYGKTTLKIGRQEINTPLAGPNDGYVIPDLFQGAVLINSDIPQTTLIAAYINGMQGGTTGDSHASTNYTPTLTPSYGVTSSQTGFNSMSRAALGSIVDVPSGITNGKSIGDQPVWALAAVNSSLPNTTAQVWYYNNTNVLQALYAELNSNITFGKDWQLYGGAQYYTIDGQGTTKTLLNNIGSTLSYNVTGLKIGLNNSYGITPEVDALFVGGSNNSIYVFGAWGGYPTYTGMAFISIGNVVNYAGFGTNGVSNASGANQWRYALTGDLSKYGLGENSLQLAYAAYSFDQNKNNGNNYNVGIWDLVYTSKNVFLKNLDIKAYYENGTMRNSGVWGGTNYANTKSVNYVLLRGIYNF